MAIKMERVAPKHLAIGLHPDPPGSLQRSPRSPSWILGVGTGKGGEWKRGGEGEGRKGREGKGQGRRSDGTTLNKKVGYGPVQCRYLLRDAIARGHTLRK